MPLRWKIFRVLCIVQLLAVSFSALELLISFFYSITLSNVAVLLLYTAIMFMCVLGVNLVNNNYPDEPVQDAQKKSFNRIFLFNFLFLSFLFAFVIREYRSLAQFAENNELSILTLPFRILVDMILYGLMLVLQLSILYGLYRLRLELYSNFMKRKFEFEKT